MNGQRRVLIPAMKVLQKSDETLNILSLHLNILRLMLRAASTGMFLGEQNNVSVHAQLGSLRDCLLFKNAAFPQWMLALASKKCRKLALVSVRTVEENRLVAALLLVFYSVLGLPDIVRIRLCVSAFSCNHSLNSTNDGRDKCRLTTCIAQAFFILGGNIAIV